MLFNNLNEHLESEEKIQNRCKENKNNIDSLVTRIASCNKVIQEEAQQGDNFKKDLEKLQQETEELKKKEVEVKDAIGRYRLQMGIIEKDCQKGLEEIDIRQVNEEGELKKKLDEQVKVKEELQNKHVSLMNQQKFGIEEIADLQNVQSDINTRIDGLREKIREIEQRDANEKRNNDEKKALLNQAKLDKDHLKKTKTELEAKVGELDRDIEATAEALRREKKDKDEQHRSKVRLGKQKEQGDKEYARKLEEVGKFENMLTEKEEDLRAKEEELAELLRTKAEVERDHELARANRKQILVDNDELNQKKTSMVERKNIEQGQLEKLVAEREKNKARIN